MHATDLSILHGKVVLVCGADDQRNPPTGRRGTLFVQQMPDGRETASVEIQFPEMYTSRAHLRRVVLTDAEIEAMLRTEHYGAFTLILPGRLDPVLAPGNE